MAGEAAAASSYYSWPFRTLIFFLFFSPKNPMNEKNAKVKRPYVLISFLSAHLDRSCVEVCVYEGERMKRRCETLAPAEIFFSAKRFSK